MSFWSESGQATVEGAFLIPVILVGLLLLVQPAIVLYDRTVMASAAAQTCRVLATGTDEFGGGAEAYVAFAKRCLSAIPEQECFHLHEGGCSYEVEVQGDEQSEQVQVCIVNRVKLLPLIDAGARAFGISAADGTIQLEVQAQMPTKSQWVLSGPLGTDPQAWVSQWD